MQSQDKELAVAEALAGLKKDKDVPYAAYGFLLCGVKCRVVDYPGSGCWSAYIPDASVYGDPCPTIEASISGMYDKLTKR